MVVDKYDCRTGGEYRYVHSRDGEDYGFHGCFHDVRPNELIVQTFTFEGVPDSVALEKLVLEDLGDGRTRLVVTSLVDSFEDRDAMVASGMETGIVEGYERLDELLAHVAISTLKYASVAASAGKKLSMLSSASVMSSAVPKVASVLNIESSRPSTVTNCMGTNSRLVGSATTAECEVTPGYVSTSS